MAKSNKQKAREANVQAFGRKSNETETSGQYVGFHNKVMPKSHRDFNTVLAHINYKLESLHKNPPRGVSLVHVQAFERLYELAMRPSLENVETAKCPRCKTIHAITCPECAEEHSIEVPSAMLEKNSIVALNKLVDKLAPNLAAVTQDLNINILVTNITEFVTGIITKYVPAEEKIKVIQDMQLAMMKATNEQ